MDDLAHPIIPPGYRPHRKPLPKWRWLPQFFINPLSVYAEESFDRLYGRARAFGIDTLAINDPEGIRYVLNTNMANYRRPVIQPRIFRPAMGQGVFLAEGETWRRQRRMLAPLFSPAATGDLIPHFQTAAEGMLGRLDGQTRVNLTEVFHRAALDAVLKALFSLQADDSHIGMTRLVRDYLESAGRPTPLDAMAVREEDFPWANGLRKKFRARWAAEVDRIIADRKAAGADNAHKRGDLLELLLSARDPQTGEGLSDAEIRDQCSTMLAAGFETTSRLLFWTTYLLALDQAEQRRIREEVKAFPAGRVAGLEELGKWPRLRQALFEAMRLYPPVAYIVRKAIADDLIAGEPVSAGTEIWISPWILHRHRRFWDRPTAFMPDRFAGKPSPWTSLEAYLPFGAGPRICIGAAFAVTEAQLILANLLSRYRLTVEGTRPVLPVFRLATVPDHEAWFGLEPVA